MRSKTLILSFILAAAATPPAYAAPALIDGNSIDDILNLARGYGSATLEAEDTNAPKITGKVDGQPYTIFFLSCDTKTHRDCEDLDFYAGHVGSKPEPDKINSWNRQTRFARAYIDRDGMAAMDMDVNTAHGVSPENMDSSLALWAQLIKMFTAFLAAK